MSKPHISVIITAYNRKDFIKEAIQSVLDQTLDKNFYEIIVVKNFRTPLDQKWRKNRVKLIYKPEGSIGEFLSAGILHARGEIIAFLDDDDTFIGNKLEIVYNIFSENPDLGYYHNKLKLIYGNNLYTNDIVMHNMKKRLLVHQNNKGSVYKFILLSAYFNLSCVAIKRELALINIEYIKKIISNTDDFFAYVAVSSASKIMCDNRILTNYRVHKKNTSISIYNNVHNQGYKRYVKMSGLFKKMLYNKKSKKNLKVLYARSARNRMNTKILNRKAIRVVDIFNYIKIYSIPFLIYCRKFDPFLLLIILSLINKKLAQEILAKRQGISNLT